MPHFKGRKKPFTPPECLEVKVLALGEAVDSRVQPRMHPLSSQRNPGSLAVETIPIPAFPTLTHISPFHTHPS